MGKKRTFETETHTLEGIEIQARKGKNGGKSNHSQPVENNELKHQFPFTRDLVLRVIERIKND